jgi:hypothetical protein
MKKNTFGIMLTLSFIISILLISLIKTETGQNAIRSPLGIFCLLNGLCMWGWMAADLFKRQKKFKSKFFWWAVLLLFLFFGAVAYCVAVVIPNKKESEIKDFLMSNFLTYVLLAITKPKKAFAILSEEANLKYAVGILFVTGLLSGLSGILYKKDGSIMMTMYFPIFIGGMSIVAGGLLFVLETLYVKLMLGFLQIKISIKPLLSAITFTLVPMLFSAMIDILWPGRRVLLHTDMLPKIVYSKTSLVQFIGSEYCYSHPKIFAFLSNIEPFAIWGFILEVVAVAIITNITYKKSFIIMFPLWIITSLLYTMSLGFFWGQ